MGRSSSQSYLGRRFEPPRRSASSPITAALSVVDTLTGVRIDAVIIGAGHNGLSAAAYLARAGLRVVVLERRSVLGGACVTEELWPGFRVSRAAYVAGLLRPRIVRELDLPARGLRLLRRDPSSFTPLRDGRSLLLGADGATNVREIGRFSARDAERYPRYEMFLERIARVVEPLLDVPPPRLPRPRLRDLRPIFAALFATCRLGRQLPQALSLALGAAGPLLETWFESEPLRATLATDALIGAFFAPSTPGTGYVLLHHVMGETFGQRGVWAYAAGGMGSISEALAGAARATGAEIRVESPVKSVLVHGGRARGVLLDDGTVIEAHVVLSNADPARTFFTLVGRESLSEDFARAVEALDFRSPVCKINLALDRLPEFHARPGHGVQPHHAATIHIGAESLADLERSFATAQVGCLPERPMIELTLPSALDASLAPAGRHVASLFVQHVPYAPEGGGWEGQRAAFADRVCALVDAVAPGFSASILHREVLVPPDLERIFGLTGGNIFHGAMTPDRLLGLRPLPGWGAYRTPLAGLYLCGAGTHPGGGVMGACGRLAALEVLRDWRNEHAAEGA